MWLLNAAIFFVLFAFALNNQEAITVRLFFGAEWQVPLVLALFSALLVGVCLGVFVMLPLWLRARNIKPVEPKRLKDTVEAASSSDASASPTL